MLTMSLRVLDGNASGRGVRVGDEVTLLTSKANGEVLLRAGADAWRVDGAEPGDEDTLSNVVDTGLPRITWVSKVDQTGTITVQVHRFAHQVRWGHDVVIGIDERTVQSVLRMLPGRRSVDQIEKWLTDEFLIQRTAEPASAVRLLASAGPEAVVLGKGFLLHGQRFIGHIDNRDGRLWLKRLQRAGRRQHETAALTLVEANVVFRDATYTNTLRERHREEFARLLSTGQQYLNHWDEYWELERRRIIDRAMALGVAQYTQVTQINSRTLRFQLDPNGGREFLSRIGDEHTALEASHQAPEGLRAGELQIDDRSDPSSFTGTIAYINEAGCIVALQVPELEEVTMPPPQGEIYLGLAGDRVRLKRQRRARRQIETLSTPMPQLGLLLEGQPVQRPDTRARMIQPRKLAAFAPYRDFTRKQEEAVRIALNTPDIALIQGPPGTGKTSVITAIQECLVQLGKEAGNVGHSVLVTSFQHDAVDEVLRRTEVLGLPGVKVSSRRRVDSNRSVRDWCTRKADELRERLSPQGELLRAVRTVETLAVGYSRQPPTPDSTVELIRQIDELAGRYLPVTVRARLARTRAELAAAAQRPRLTTDELEPLRRAVAGIRVDPISFADDGPHVARKVLLRLSAQNNFAAEDLALLKEAANYNGDAPPPFLESLADLRVRLLDATAPVTAPLQTAADDELVNLLSNVVRTLRDRLASSADGVAAAVEEFLDELEHDPDAVADAIRHFTAVVAATCQHSASRAMADQVAGNHILFDTVIVDEAARANPLDLMIPLCLATRRIILVGDHRQLPHLLEPDIERELESSAEEQMLRALRQSMFERLFDYLREGRKADGLTEREITLDTQFRMHRVLGEFVSDAFYADDTALASGPNTDALHHRIERYGEAVAVWADLSRGRHGSETGGRSKSRLAEATWIAAELGRLTHEVPASMDFGVIAFYRAQVEAIWAELDSAGLATRTPSGQYQATGPLTDRLHVGTVDAFQGREFDIVLLSVTRSNNLPGGQPRTNRRKYGHLLLTNRLCVAMSRQKRLLIAVGDAAMFDAVATGGEVRGLVMFKALCNDRRYGRVLRV